MRPQSALNAPEGRKSGTAGSGVAAFHAQFSQDDQSAFLHFQEGLRSKLGDGPWRAWAADLRLGRTNAHEVVVWVSAPLHRERILDRVGPRRVAELWRDADVHGRTVSLGLDPSPADRPGPVVNDVIAAEPKPADGAAMEPEADLGPQMDRERTFATFVTGDANRVAATAAKTLATDRSAPFRACVLHGENGAGKTHLLTAIQQSATQAAPDWDVVFYNADRFRADYVQALNAKDAIAFKDRLSAADLLLIDDLHLLIGAKSTQAELAHIVAAIIANGGRVAAAADRPLEQIEDLDPRLRTRFEAGVSCELGKPDLTLRRRILDRMIADNPGLRRGRSVPAEVIDFIASAVVGSPRQLEAALATVLLRTVMVERPVTRQTAKEALGEMLSGAARRVTVEDIQKCVAAYHGLKLSDLLSKRRTREIVRPRQQAMYLCKEMTTRSLPDIARRFGQMDHTTVLYSCRRIKALCNDDPGVRSDVDAIRRMLRQRGSRTGGGLGL